MLRSEAAWAARAEFYLCLARAFLPPVNECAYRGFTHYMVDDLAELSATLGYPIAGPLDALRAALAATPDTQTLLQAYSKLFLVPPLPAHLSAGWYLDGAYRGAGMACIESTYRRYGLARSPDFHDVPDHLAAELEFVAFMYGSAVRDSREAGVFVEEAAGFLQRYVRPWLPALCADIAAAVAKYSLPAVYLHLARIAEAAVGCDAASVAASAHAPAAVAPAAADAQHACRRCGVCFAVEEDLRVMRAALQREGLEATSLDVCPECRTADLGLRALPLPTLGRHRD